MNVNELKERILKNDNRCTAQPYLLLLQEKEWHVTKEGYGYDTKEVYVEILTGDYCQRDSLEDLRNWYYADLPEDEKEEWLEGSHYEKRYMGYTWNTINVFFTDKGYQEHLEQNSHNLKEHRTYGIHAFRNSEMKAVYNLLMNGANK